MILKAFFAALLLAPLLAGAQQYRWIDKDGRVQFSDSPPPAGARDVRRSAPAAAGAAPSAPKPAPAAEAPLPFELQLLQKNYPVTLYTSPTCKQGCELARGALNKRGVPFKEVQVWDPESNDELKRVSGSNDVPTLLVGRSVQKGFEQGAFDSLLDSAGYPKAGVMPARAQKAPGQPEGYVPEDAPRPVAQPVEAAPASKAGPYDTSGLKGPAPKPGIYDPSGLTGPAPKPGQYGVPGEASK